jgi:aminopeptidase N
VDEVPAGAGRAWSFTLSDVRDVSIVLAPDFRVTAGDVDGLPIRVYTRPGGLSASRLMTQAVHAVSAESAQLGMPYPAGILSVVQTQGGYGLESPGLIWIPRDVDALNLAYLVHHETAHQWFYGLVGSDQQGQPFVDEAAADLLARTVLGTLRKSRCPVDTLDKAITAYSETCYYEVIYVQGGLVLDEIRRAMGNERFWGALAVYLQANRHGLAGTTTLLDGLRGATSADLGPILRARFPHLYP